MRKLATRCFVVLIAVLMCGCAQEVKATEPATETEFEFFVASTPETEVVTETQKADTSFVVKDGSVEMYHGDDLYWAWDDTELSDDAVVTMLSEHNWLFVAQDGQKVWLLKRESVELIAENGLVFDYSLCDSPAKALLAVNEGKLSFQKLYPNSIDGVDTVDIATDIEVAELCNRYVLKDVNGDYYAFRANWGKEDLAFEAVRLGQGRVLDDDVAELSDNSSMEQRELFLRKYGVRSRFWK
jgi:hypothetical protein